MIGIINKILSEREIRSVEHKAYLERSLVLSRRLGYQRAEERFKGVLCDPRQRTVNNYGGVQK